MANRKDDSSKIEKRVLLQERKQERYMRNTASSSSSVKASSGAEKSVFFNDRQRNEAELVHKLPKDFPVDRWDKMPTKAQLTTMRHSGLNDQDQWTLLNATTPLGTLSVLNKIQGGLDAKLHSPQKAASLAKAANQLVAEQRMLNSGTTSELPALQKKLLRGELDNRLEELNANTDRTTKSVPMHATISTRMPMRQVGLLTGKTPTSTPKPEITSKPEKGLAGIWDRLKTWVDQIFTPENKTPTSTPETLLIQTEVPIKTPKMTQPPSPTPTPTPTPVPTPSERENLAEDGVSFVKKMIGEPYSNVGRTGTKGYDCSGLVIAMCKTIESKLPFDNNHIRTTSKFGMSQSFLNNPEYGEPIYKYQDGGSITELQAGDLVFSAKPGNLKQDSHVSIATGEMLYDSETKKYWPQVVEASSVTGTVTDIYPAFNEMNDEGYYSRSHTNQIITYVIRPNYDWEEQP